MGYDMPKDHHTSSSSLSPDYGKPQVIPFKNPVNIMHHDGTLETRESVLLANDPVHGLPTDAKVRKNAPMARGVLDYFPDALFEVADLSRIGNEQHNPGQEMHWAKEKSTDHADCIMRHLVDRGTRDTDGVRHATKVAWRALAMLQIEIEADRK